MNKTVRLRSNIKVEITSFERVLGIVSFVMLVMLWLYLFTNWSSVPDKIPTHFGFSGIVDAWGGKSSIIFLPIVMTVLYLMMMQVGLGNAKSFGLWFLPIFLVVTFGTLIYYIRKMNKLK